MLKPAALIFLATLALAAQTWGPRSGYRATASAVEIAGPQPYFEFQFPKTEGRLLIERVSIRIADAPGTGACGFGDPSANRVETPQIQVPLAGVPQRVAAPEWRGGTIDSAQAIIVDAGSSYTIRVAGRCGAAAAKATVIGSWVQ